MNGRLEDGEPGKPLVEWLNGQPEVQEVLQLRFGGRPISWNREAERLDEQAHEREIKALKQRANAPIRAALETGSLAKIFADGEKGRLIAAMMSDLNHAFDPGMLTSRKPSPPQSPAPLQTNQSESNPIKPDQTPRPSHKTTTDFQTHIRKFHPRPGFQFISATQPTLKTAP
jgi:hypothetical protein